MLNDRGLLASMLGRAEALGVPALMLTVDLARPGARYRDLRSGFSAPPSFGRSVQRLFDGIGHPRWLWDVGLHGRPHGFGNLAGAAAEGAGFEAFWE